MSVIHWRQATRADVARVVALLADDILGAGREVADLAVYQAAFEEMANEADNHLVVGEMSGAVVATYQITYITGLSLGVVRRAQLESIRVAVDRRGQGIGTALLQDAEERARGAGCALIQLTSNTVRTRAKQFYEANGFVASHAGFKRALS